MTEIGKFYHLSYEVLQPLGFVGSWELSRDQHMDVISRTFSSNGRHDLNVLYLGTATAKNPIDVKNAISESGYSSRVTVVDIAKRPLDKLAKKDPDIKTVKLDACSMPFPDSSFDVVTTDFLFNMCPLEHCERIAGEIGRVLAQDGVMTMTIFTRENQVKNPQSFLINHFSGKHFASEWDWLRVFDKAGMDLDIQVFQSKRKPFLYHTDNFTQLIATKK